MHTAGPNPSLKYFNNFLNSSMSCKSCEQKKEDFSSRYKAKIRRERLSICMNDKPSSNRWVARYAGAIFHVKSKDVTSIAVLASNNSL